MIPDICPTGGRVLGKDGTKSGERPRRRVRANRTVRRPATEAGQPAAPTVSLRDRASSSYALALMVAAGAAGDDRGQPVFRDEIMGMTVSEIRFG